MVSDTPCYLHKKHTHEMNITCHIATEPYNRNRYHSYQEPMNRKKKIHDIFRKKLKKAKAKLSPNKKPKYIAKALREKAELQQPELDNEK